MKKIIILIAVAFLFSCKKESVVPVNPKPLIDKGEKIWENKTFPTPPTTVIGG